MAASDLTHIGDAPQQKDLDKCVHCGLCAERCPTGAWDMQKSKVHIPNASTDGIPCEPQATRQSA